MAKVYALSETTAAQVQRLISDHGGAGPAATSPPGFRHFGWVHMDALSASGTYLNATVTLIRVALNYEHLAPCHVVTSGNPDHKLLKGKYYLAQLVGVDSDGVSLWCAQGERIWVPSVVEVSITHSGTTAPGTLTLRLDKSTFDPATDTYLRVTTFQTVPL